MERGSGRAEARGYACSAAFTSSNDLLSMSNYVGDANGTVSYLTSLVARLRTLSGGQSLVLARDDAVSGLCIFIVHRCSAAHAGSEFVVAICSSGTEALQYHPSRADAASGGTLQHASPLLLRDVPATRVCDGSFWYFALLAERKWCTPQVLFEKLCPALNAKPLLANWSEVTHPTGTAEADSVMVDGAALGERATPRWWAASSDAQGYDLCHLAAITLLQLSCEGYDDPSLSASAGGEGSYTAGGLELLMQHMLLNAAHADLERLGHTKPGAPPMPPATLELLTRATRRCSASTAARVRGAESLRASDLQTMQDELAGLKRTSPRCASGVVTTPSRPPSHLRGEWRPPRQLQTAQFRSAT